MMLLSQPFLPVLLLSLLISVHVNSTRGRFSSSSRKSKNDMKVEEDLQFFSSVTRGRSGGDTSVEEDFSLYAINHDQILTLPSIINLVKTEIDQFPSAKTIATNWLNTWKSKLIFTPSRGIAGIDQIDLQFLPESGDPAKEYDNCLLSTYNFKTHTSHISDLMTQKMSGSSRFYSCPSGHTLVQLHDSISKILGMEQSTLVDAAAFTFSRNPGFPLSNNFWIMVPLVKALLVPMSTPRLVFTDVSYYAKDGYKFIEYAGHKNASKIEADQVSGCQGLRKTLVKHLIPTPDISGCSNAVRRLDILLSKLDLDPTSTTIGELFQLVHLHVNNPPAPRMCPPSTPSPPPPPPPPPSPSNNDDEENIMVSRSKPIPIPINRNSRPAHRRLHLKSVMTTPSFSSPLDSPSITGPTTRLQQEQVDLSSQYVSDREAIQFLSSIFPVLFYPLGDRSPTCFTVPDQLIQRCSAQGPMIKDI